jgi:hypothetical protein
VGPRQRGSCSNRRLSAGLKRCRQPSMGNVGQLIGCLRILRNHFDAISLQGARSVWHRLLHSNQRQCDYRPKFRYRDLARTASRASRLQRGPGKQVLRTRYAGRLPRSRIGYTFVREQYVVSGGVGNATTISNGGLDVKPPLPITLMDLPTPQCERHYGVERAGDHRFGQRDECGGVERRRAV